MEDTGPPRVGGDRAVPPSQRQNGDASSHGPLELAPGGRFAVRRNGTIVHCNSAFAAMLGARGAASIVGEDLARRLVRPEAFEEMVRTLECGAAWEGRELELKRADGGIVGLVTSARLHAAGLGEGDLVLGCAIDVTESRTTERARRDKEQLDDLARLAGGVAHTFNNLLSIIRMSVASVAESPLLSEVARYELAEADRAALRASDLAQLLLAFGRQQMMSVARIDLADIVRKSEPHIARLVGDDVHVSIRLPDGVAPVMGDAAQLERVLVMLSANAREAMPAGGLLMIAVDILETTAFDRARQAAMKPGLHVCLSVRDCGVGMEAATQARIFEPFFSTKNSAANSGLGLASVHGAVSQLGGCITVDSAPGQGTAFHVWFPIAEPAGADTALATETATPAATSSAEPMRRRVVLLVEDEIALRSVIQRVLSQRGFEVLAMSDAQAALNAANDRNGPIDLVITDVVLPGLSGQAMAEQLELRRPGIRFLFMSGYSVAAVLKQGLLRRGTELLTKPFTPAVLLERVNAALDGPSDPAPELDLQPRASPARRPPATGR